MRLICVSCAFNRECIFFSYEIRGIPLMIGVAVLGRGEGGKGNFTDVCRSKSTTCALDFRENNVRV